MTPTADLLRIWLGTADRTSNDRQETHATAAKSESMAVLLLTVYLTTVTLVTDFNDGEFSDVDCSDGDSVDFGDVDLNDGDFLISLKPLTPASFSVVRGSPDNPEKDRSRFLVR